MILIGILSFVVWIFHNPPPKMTEGIPNVLIILPSEPPPEIIVFADNPKLRALSVQF